MEPGMEGQIRRSVRQRPLRVPRESATWRRLGPEGRAPAGGRGRSSSASTCGRAGRGPARRGPRRDARIPRSDSAWAEALCAAGGRPYATRHEVRIITEDVDMIVGFSANMILDTDISADLNEHRVHVRVCLSAYVYV